MPALDLSPAEIERLLQWADGCDRESYIDKDDWSLIVKLAEQIGKDPESVAPNVGFDVRAERAGLDAALREFQERHGRWPGVAEQTAIRDRLRI